MDDLAFLRERIESYADYTNDDARHLTDEQIRAYTGEALSRMHERLQPAGAAGEALASVLLRCQFADQRVVRALDTDGLGTDLITALHTADREIVALADQTDRADAAAAGALIAHIDAAFDGRSEVILTGVAALESVPRSRVVDAEPR